MRGKSHLLIVLLALLAASGQLLAQGEFMLRQMKENPNMSEEAKRAMIEKMQGRGGGRWGRGRGGEKKPDEGKKPDEEKNKEKKEGEGEAKPEKPEESDTVKRPEKPKRPANPAELEVMPADESGLVLKFQGHPWPALIDWYSRASQREVEWRELPKGFVNLRTSRKFTMVETADLLNRLLLARGYTMLDDGEFLIIEKTEGINPALVPRVRPAKLESMLPHGFARTSFRLTRVKAEEVVKELESMKSKHGTLTAMAAANRIEAMDTVQNLRDMYSALDEEEASGKHKPREFVLKHVRAATVQDKLKEMLGLAKAAAPMTPQQMQEMARRRQQQQQQNKGKPQPAKTEEKISLVVNEVNNSIIVLAPAHRMADIADTIEYLDIPSQRGGLDSYVDRVKTYRFATLDPAEVKTILEETAGLDPSTQIRVDKTSKALIASAPPWDHMVIAKLVEKLDGSLRSFKVVPLRRLRALQVATTIETMMGEEKKDNRRRRFWWDDNQQEDKTDKFRVGADTEYNRLLLKCNDTEFQTVLSLLEQLGEVPQRAQNASRTRILDATQGQDDEEFLRRVQEAFRAMGGENEIVLPPAIAPKPAPEPDANEDQLDSKTVGDATPNSRLVSAPNQPVVPTVYTQVRRTNAATATPDTAPAQASSNDTAAKTSTGPARSTPPPIVIVRGPDGKLMLKSDDTAALDTVESLMRRMAAENGDWVHFRLKNVTAFWMKTQLEDFFDEEDGQQLPFFFWDWDDRQDDSPPGLGDEPKLRFIDDGASTLVVRNANPKQLATIRQLIELYDVADPPNEQSARFKQMIHIKHSKARAIETALKEAFRDLLSSNDKAFQNNQRNGEERGGRRRGFGFPFGLGDDSEGLGGSTFKGKLSFGVDESTNVLIVTAEGRRLLEIVVDMVKELDKAAVPTDEARVVTIPESVNSASLRESLVRMFGPESVRGGGSKPGEEKGKPNQGEGDKGPGEGKPRGRRL